MPKLKQYQTADLVSLEVLLTRTQRDYLHRISKHTKTSMSGYVRRLVQADMNKEPE
jgi:hypothetical protein